MATTGDVARALGITPNTVKSWIRAGKLDAIRLPSGHYRVPRGEIDRLLREGRSRAQREQVTRSFRDRAEAWRRFASWNAKRAPTPVTLEESLVHLDAMLELASTHASLPPSPVEAKVRRVARLHRALAALST